MRAGESNQRVFWLLSGVTLFVWCLFPSVVRWTIDEPILFQKAMDANAQGIVWSWGLRSTQGFMYGPVPVWWYRLSLLLFGRPDAWVLFKVLTHGAIVLFCLWFLSQHLVARLGGDPKPRWLAETWFFWISSSPFLWLYVRFVWDNVFLVPLGLALVCVWVQLWQRPRLPWVVLFFVIVWAMVHTHLMSLFLILPFTGSLMWRYRREILAAQWLSVGLAIVGSLSFLPYAWYLSTAERGPGYGVFAWENAFKFLSWQGSVLVGSSFFEYVLTDWRFVTALFCGPGLIVFVLGLRAVLLRCSRREASALEWVSLVSMALGIAVPVLMQVPPEPHYANALWGPGSVVLWMGIQSLPRHSLRTWAAVWGGAANSVLLAAALYLLISQGGTRHEHFGISLGEQWAMACRIGTGGRVVENSVPVLAEFPQTLRTLVSICAAPSEPVPWRVRYLEPNRPLDARVVLEPALSGSGR